MRPVKGREREEEGEVELGVGTEGERLTRRAGRRTGGVFFALGGTTLRRACSKYRIYRNSRTSLDLVRYRPSPMQVIVSTRELPQPDLLNPSDRL